MINESVELAIYEDLTFKTVLEQQIKLRRFIEKSSQNAILIINLSAVQRSDSAGLALILDALRLSYHLKKTIFFKSMPKQMLSMMRFCDIFSLFEKVLL